MTFLKKFIDLVLYSNGWIALGALSMVWQIELLLGDFQWTSNYGLFLFFATLFVYTGHRLIGFTVIEKTIQNRRFSVINSFRNHKIIYGIVSAIGAFYYVLGLNFDTVMLLGIPTLLAALYIIPVFNGRRFRDLPYLKLFTVGIVWSWMTVSMPYHEATHMFTEEMGLLTVEKMCFIIGITIPFDIRDIEVDTHYKIKTFPIVIGVKNSKFVALACLGIGLILGIWLYSMGTYSTGQIIGLSMSYFITIILVSITNENRHDYFFSGILDGTIILQFLLVYGCTSG